MLLSAGRHRCQEPGWNSWSEAPFSDGAAQLYFWSQDAADLQLTPLPSRTWFDFLTDTTPVGVGPAARCGFAEELLEAGLARLATQRATVMACEETLNFSLPFLVFPHF